jgi:hypothetical protein
MTKCKECGAATRVVRVIVLEATTWREVQCLGPERHRTIRREEIGNAAEYRRIRAAYMRERRRPNAVRPYNRRSKNDDTRIIKMRVAS